MDRESVLALTLTLAVVLGAAYRHAVSPPEGSTPPGVVAAPATTAASYDLDDLLARADPGQGRVLFLQCQACHPVVAGEQSPRGPNLSGLLGRRVAADPGYAYSDELRAMDFRWTPERLDQLFRQPGEVLPRSRMTMLPIAGPQDRAHLIAYLQTIGND